MAEENKFRDWEEFLEKPVVVFLKDNRFFYGTFKSFDQYNSVTLNYAIERIFDKDEYGEKFHGLFVIRGDVIVLIGLCSFDAKNLKKVDYDVIKRRVGQLDGSL